MRRPQIAAKWAIATNVAAPELCSGAVPSLRMKGRNRCTSTRGAGAKTMRDSATCRSFGFSICRLSLLQEAALVDNDGRDVQMININRMVLVAALAVSASNAWAIDPGDAVAGKVIFSHTCQNCHSVEIGVNKVGPSLWNVVGRQAASIPDFSYSDAMKANKSAWTTSSLDAYLADPRGDLHGVKMYFKGLPAAKDRADVVAYLQTLK